MADTTPTGTTDIDVPDTVWAEYLPDAGTPTATASATGSPTAGSDNPTTPPAATPAPAAATPAPADTADHEPDEIEQTPAGRDPYARRRRRYAGIAVVVAVAAAYFLGGRLFGPADPPVAGADQVQTGVQAASPAAPQQVSTDLDTATEVLAISGDLTGIHFEGARVAAAGTTMYASRDVGGVCWGYGIVDGQVTDPQQDVTGAVCTDEAIAATQAQLDTVFATAQAQSREDGVTAIQQAAALVGWYGSRNLVSGAPDLTGLTLPDQSVVVSANTGTSVRLTTTAGGLCTTAVVSADGTLAGLPAACS